jgi:hypothetical protein
MNRVSYQYESRCAWKQSPITHPIHLLSSLKYGGKNPVTWLQSRNGVVCKSDSSFQLVWMRSFISVMLPDGDGRLVSNNSQDLTTSEGVTQVSAVIFLCVSRYSTCFVLRFPSNFRIMWASVNNTSDKCCGWTLIFSSKEIKKLFKKFADPGWVILTLKSALKKLYWSACHEKQKDRAEL